jgi:NAD(P)-dependent dehydrogenase (short-subunit alcohol dehydrogenase family)
VTGDLQLSGRTVLVTGAAGDGIGKAIARRSATNGATVVVTDVHARRINDTVLELEETGATTIGLHLDITDPTAAGAALLEAIKLVGPIHVLVNNAALNEMGDIFDFELDRFSTILTADLVTPWYLSRLAFPSMRDAGGGVIINISSVAPDVGQAYLEPPYSVAKGGLHALTKGLARAGGPYNVRCNAITMGVVEDTRFMRVNRSFVEQELPKIPLGRHARTDDIVEAFLYLASDRGAFVNGEILNVDGGYRLS